MVGKNMRDSIGTKSPLTGAHAATGKSLCLVRADTSERNHIANLARSHFFTTAHNGFISRVQKGLLQTIKSIEKGPNRKVAIARADNRPGQSITAGNIDKAQLMRHLQARELPAQTGSPCTGYSGTITRGEYSSG